MKSKRIFAIMTAAMLSAALLAGCGNSDSDSDKKSASSESSQSADADDKASSDTNENGESSETSSDENISVSDVVGKWESVEIIDSGQTYTDEYNGITVSQFMQMELNEDCTMRGTSSGLDKDVSGIWTLDGGKLYTIFDDDDDDEDPDAFEFKDGYLVLMSDDDFQVNLRKVSQFTPIRSKSDTAGFDLIGKWEVAEICINDQVIDGSQEFDGVITATTMQLDFHENGICAMNLVDDVTNTVKPNEATWEADGDTISVSIDGDAREFVIDGDQLRFDIEDPSMEIVCWLHKVNEFTPIK